MFKHPINKCDQSSFKWKKISYTCIMQLPFLILIFYFKFFVKKVTIRRDKIVLIITIHFFQGLVTLVAIMLWWIIIVSSVKKKKNTHNSQRLFFLYS